MSGDKCPVVRSQSASDPEPAQGPQRLGRFSSLTGVSRSTSEGIINPMSQVREDLSVSSEDVRGADSGSICASMTRPLADSPTSNLDRENQLRGIKAAIARVSSIATNRQSLKGNPSLPGPEGFDRSWQGIEHYLRQRTHDTDPEALTRHKKPFHQRTWFACTIYGALLALMVAAILALACTRSVIMPRMVLDGEVTRRPWVQQPEQVPSQLQQDQSPNDVTTPLSTTDSVSRQSPSLLELISNAATTTTTESTTKT